MHRNLCFNALRCRRWIGLVSLCLLATVASPSWAQQEQAGPSGGPSAGAGGPSAGESSTATDQAADADQPPSEGDFDVQTEQLPGVNLLRLVMRGGALMIPLALMSLLVVGLVIERTFATRRRRIIPDPLVRGIGRLGGPNRLFDPRDAYRLCQRYPSAAATVIRGMLVKTGRPIEEIETTVRDISQREADRMYANVRWLNLAAAVAPLLGLLGTVWGMIRAFHDTTQLATGVNKATYLAEGIYVALVTTLCGLAIAIPAAIAAHYFEGRIQSMFHHIDELMHNLVPQIEKYEGRVRFGRHVVEEEMPQDNGDAPEERKQRPKVSSSRE